MTGRAFVIEPAIDRNHSGHNLNIIKVLSHALENTEQFYLVSAKAEHNISDVNGAMLPIFPPGFTRLSRKLERSSRMSNRFAKRFFIRIAGLDISPFAEALNASLAEKEASPSDHLIISSGSTTLAAILLKALRERPVATWPHIHIRMFAQRFDDPAPDDDTIMSELQAAQQSSLGRFHIYTETQALREKLESRYGFSNVRVFLLPINAPVHNSAKPARDGFALGFLGPIRRDKGAYRLASILEQLIKLKEADGPANKLRLIIQDDGGKRARSILSAIARLSGKHFDLEIISGKLDETAFAQLIGSCHALLLPYDSNAYALRGSGVISDAVSMRVPFVMSRGMAMAEWAIDGNGLQADTDAEFAAALLEIERNAEKFRAATDLAAKRLVQATINNSMIKRIHGTD